MSRRCRAAPGFKVLLPPACLVLVALAGCTSGPPDPDEDGLEDADELAERVIRVVTANGTETRRVTSDPRVADTDGDGLLDGQEWDALTDARDVDTDRDGLLDGPDLVVQEGTPFFQMLMERGIVRARDDGRFLGEASLGTNPFEFDSDRPVRDGLSDGDEAAGWEVDTTVRGRYTTDSDPTRPDTDGDGLNDREEQRRGCDPRLADSDDDGTPDAVDAHCTRDVRLRITVASVTLDHALDPDGGADLVLVVQTSGEPREHTQTLRRGLNTLDLVWEVQVPDDGAWQQLEVPVAMEAWDRDLAGDDPDSGVQRQPLRFAGDHNALTLTLDPFTGRWGSASPAFEAEGSHTLRGTDGSLTMTLEGVFG